MYLVEWRTIYRPGGIHESAQSETYKIAIPERTDQEHLVKVLCDKPRPRAVEVKLTARLTSGWRDPWRRGQLVAFCLRMP